MTAPKPVLTLAQKRAELLKAMASYLGGAKDLGSLRRDIENLNEPTVDGLLRHYANPVHVG